LQAVINVSEEPRRLQLMGKIRVLSILSFWTGNGMTEVSELNSSIQSPNKTLLQFLHEFNFDLLLLFPNI
jgi:hypothetical protein